MMPKHSEEHTSSIFQEKLQFFQKKKNLFRQKQNIWNIDPSANANADGDAKMQMLRFLNGRFFFVFLSILISISAILEAVISRHCQSGGLENSRTSCDRCSKVSVADLDFSQHPK